MADQGVPHFQNDNGATQIKIGVKKFMCCGASAPYDHPHIFLDIGSSPQSGEEIVCPYCSTLFKFSDKLNADQTEPENCLFQHAPS